MKILFASDVYFSRSNGTTISAQRFVTRLRERGHEVRVLTNYDERPYPNPICTLSRLKNYPDLIIY